MAQYSSTNQHMRCSFEGFLTLYATLYKKYLNELVDQNLLKIKRTSRKCSCCNNWPQRLSKGRESWTSKNASKSHRKTLNTRFSRYSKPFWCFTEWPSTIFTYLYEALRVTFTFYLSNQRAEAVTALSQFTWVSQIFFLLLTCRITHN